jgi:hypothetical protein
VDAGGRNEEVASETEHERTACDERRHQPARAAVDVLSVHLFTHQKDMALELDVEGMPGR